MKAEETVSRFFGLGVGTMYNRIDRVVGIQKERAETCQLTVAPEAGMRFGYDFSISTYISIRYTYSFKTTQINSQSYFSLTTGLMLR